MAAALASMGFPRFKTRPRSKEVLIHDWNDSG
jgi:hypothetical protein